MPAPAVVDSAAKPFTDHRPLTPTPSADTNCWPASGPIFDSSQSSASISPLPPPPLQNSFTSEQGHLPIPSPQRGRPLDVRASQPLPTAPDAQQQSNLASAASLTNRITHDAIASPPNAALAGPKQTPPEQNYHLQRPFRSLAARRRDRHRPPAAYLWNPANSTPRDQPRKTRPRRPSTPPEPSVRIDHPDLDVGRLTETPQGDYPLLSLPQVLHLRNPGSQRSSLQADRRASKISLPTSVRASYDGKRSRDPTPTIAEFDPSVKDSAHVPYSETRQGKSIMAADTTAPAQSFTADLERGPDATDHRRSTASLDDGIGSAISSEDSSIMGEELDPDDEAWGPHHPCYPHINPHVPVDSPEHASTRIIRIKRDWMVAGDLAPTFSNLYPEILDPAGMSEPEFRRVIDKLNGELVPIFKPYSMRNTLDGVLGALTGWLWDDLGFTGAKSRLNKLEKWIEDWNKHAERTMEPHGAALAPKLISLRQTGYMSLDIQIPDPEIAAAPSTSGPGDSRSVIRLDSAPRTATPA
ncbi:Golgin subfamily A member 7/ERF4 family-domain-containing protein [Emericellopsis atlantica]|uniref:Ras modification protein ERF4 n=1 Tax=Emericellopsis atlantica TaxID=2614577 RepID=A0A9P7ZTK9_9HYPO|nr:Golgin subfamily A member 7/ERF4 family-domain-containing protein [Emericellopsis atlantica]KAG9258025.1 Golgin subfamily A member 7/ERF4 family-domain-containing protein [Emericellopsis atlantica]